MDGRNPHLHQQEAGMEAEEPGLEPETLIQDMDVPSGAQSTLPQISLLYTASLDGIHNVQAHK